MAYEFSKLLEDQVLYRSPDCPQSPVVSVILPTYKIRGEMNRRAIESVLGQTFGDFEFIIVDDGSVEGLFEILQEYQRQDARIILVRHSVNSGLPAARQDEGILLARGKYIAYMFEDDYWLPFALESLVSTAEAVGKECVVYGEAEFIRRDRANAGVTSLGAWDFDYSELKHGNMLAVCAMLHHRSIFDVCGLHDPHILMRRLSDYDLWLRIGKIFPFVRLKRTIARVEAQTQYSLGASIDQDVLLTFRYMNTERNSQLLPENIHHFDVEVLPFVTRNEDAYRIREHFIIPFWVQHPRLLTAAERKIKLASRNTVNRVLVTKSLYATSIDVNIGNFAQILPRDVFGQVFFPEQDLTVVNPDNFDTIVYYKTLDQASLLMQEKARQDGKTNIYLLDDNLLKTGTGYMAEEFHYLRPGTTRFNNLEWSLKSVDLVLPYAQKTVEDVQPYNPRIAKMSTNIRERYILHAAPVSGGKSTGRRLKYAIFTGTVRRKELEAIWPQLQKFFANHKDEVEFHVWGVDPKEFGSLDCPVFSRAFENSYEKYLNALTEEKFDFMLSPIFDDHEAKMSKTPIKYLEGTAAGAVGIFSDAVIYKEVEDGVTGLKTNQENWLAALERSWQLPDEARVKIHAAARNHILRTFTTESQALDFLAAFEAADLHRKLRSVDSADGKARIAYFFHESVLGGATQHLLKHALIARSYGFEPILCFTTRRKLRDEMRELLEKYGLEYVQLEFVDCTWVNYVTPEGLDRADQILQWFKEKNVRMVHLITHAADVMEAAKMAQIPVVITLHAYFEAPEDYQQPTGLVQKPYVSVIHSSSLRYAWKWSEVLECPAFCIRAPIEDKYFEEYAERSKKQTSAVPTVLVSGTLQPRKRQLETIRAVQLLKKRGIRVRLVLLGYDDLRGDYADECRKEIASHGLEDMVEIPGFAMDPKQYYDQADFLLCPSDLESMPQTILKAMASGLKIISTPVGGVRELLPDGFSGVITNGFEPSDLADAIERAIKISPEQWQDMLLNSHLTANMSCKEDVVRYQLLKVYNVGCDEAQKSGGAAQEKGFRKRHLFYLLQPSWRGGLEQANARRLSLLGLTYRFRVPYDRWNGLTITLGTYLQRFKGKVRITIRRADRPLQNLRVVDLEGDQIVDNGPCGVYFEPIDKIAGKEVIVSVQAITLKPFPKLAVYEAGRDSGHGPHWLAAINNRGGNLLGNLIFLPADEVG